VTEVPEAAVESLLAVPQEAHALTIGNFDGLHLGHQYLLSKLVDRANAKRVRSLVITFEPHPISVLRPDQAVHRLATASMKPKLIEAAGVDDLAIIPFSLEFAALSAEEFLEFIHTYAHPTDILVGDDFRFGAKRAGDAATIRQFASTHGFDATIIQRIEFEGQIVSSSYIRACLASGDVRGAAAALGRNYRLSGTVEHGLARGRDMGYPTANIDLDDHLLIPSDGIYAAYARVGESGSPRPAMVYIGRSPTFEARGRTVEAHLLDFHEDLYARHVSVEFVDFVRGDQRFSGADELAEQMQRDEDVTRRVLAESAPEEQGMVR
jgi:riboflavin kinase / FMN adenylyltransferase